MVYRQIIRQHVPGIGELRLAYTRLYEHPQLLLIGPHEEWNVSGHIILEQQFLERDVTLMGLHLPRPFARLVVIIMRLEDQFQDLYEGGAASGSDFSSALVSDFPASSTTSASAPSI